MVIYLVNMKSGLARCARVAHSMGAKKIVLVNSSPIPRRNLFSARAIKVETSDVIPSDVLILETNGKTLLEDLEWANIGGIAVGGAGHHFGRDIQVANPSARIVSRRPCLIGDQALAIALYQRSIHQANLFQANLLQP